MKFKGNLNLANTVLYKSLPNISLTKYEVVKNTIRNNPRILLALNH